MGTRAAARAHCSPTPGNGLQRPADQPSASSRGERAMNGDQEGESLIAAVIDKAEPLRDPLEGLVERVAINSAAAFDREVVERLAALKQDDPRAFNAWRFKLRKAGCPVKQLDEAIAEEAGEIGHRGSTKVDKLLELAQA